MGDERVPYFLPCRYQVSTRGIVILKKLWMSWPDACSGVPAAGKEPGESHYPDGEKYHQGACR